MTQAIMVRLRGCRARRIDGTVKEALTQRDTGTLLSMAADSDDGRLAHATPDHWLPSIHACGASGDGDRVRFPGDGFDWGSISIRNVVLG